MKQITSYGPLAEALTAVLKNRIAANCAPDRDSLEKEIAAGLLWGERLPEGIVLLRRGGGPQRLRFLLTEPEALCRLSFDRTTVLELPYRRGDEKLPALAEALKTHGWAEALRRVRLTRKPAPMGPSEPREGSVSPVTVMTMLRACFSPLTGCLPEEAELAEDLAAGRVLTRDGGLIRWREKGRVSEIRHLAVDPAKRGQGLAKALVSEYLAQNGERLCRVWTAADNHGAKRVYERFGYAEDGWESVVLVYSRPML